MDIRFMRGSARSANEIDIFFMKEKNYLYVAIILGRSHSKNIRKTAVPQFDWSVRSILTMFGIRDT